MPVRVDTSKPYAENRKNIDQCVAQADRNYPVDILSSEVEDYDPIKVSCTSYGNSTSCRSSGGYSTRHVLTDMNASRALDEFDSCMKKKGIPLITVPQCFGAKDGEYCYGHIYPRERGAYSGRDLMLNGTYWRRKYFALEAWGVGGRSFIEYDIARNEGGKFNPDQVTGIYE